MKKLMVVSQLVMVLAAVTCISAADVCIHVPDDLMFNTCLQYQNNYYTGTFKYSPVQNLPDGGGCLLEIGCRHSEARDRYRQLFSGQ